MDVSAQAQQYGQELTDRGLPKTAKTWMESLEGKDIWGNGRIVQQRQDQQMIDAVQQARLAQSEAESADLRGQQGAQTQQMRARAEDSVAQADQSEQELRSRARAARQESDVQALGAVEMQRMRASAEREKAQEQASQRQRAQQEREEAEKARAQAQRQAEQTKSQQGQSDSSVVSSAMSTAAAAAAAAVAALAVAIESSAENQQFYDSWMDDMLAAQSIEDDQEYFATREGLMASFDERFGDVPEYADNPIFTAPAQDTEVQLEGAPEEVHSAMARMEDLSYLDEAEDAMSTEQANDYLQSVDEFADEYDQWCEDRGILGEFSGASDQEYSLPVSDQISAGEDFAHPLADVDVAGAIAQENALGSDDLFESVSMEDTHASQEALEA